VLRQELDPHEITSFKSGNRNTCSYGTRVDLLRRIERWIGARPRTNQGEVYWLHGKAGSGKSIVANTVAAMVQQQGYLLSCFFCKRDDPSLSNPKKVLPALALRFAEQHDSYRVALMKFLHEGNKGVGIAETTDVTTQVERLFTKLLPLTIDPYRPHVVVVDALDECGSSQQQTKLVHALLRLSRAAPWIKVFLTSRDKARVDVASGMGSQCVFCDINNDIHTDQDIELYISSQSEALGLQLSEDETRVLVQRAEGLFVWCSTLFRYLSGQADVRGALNKVLSGDRQHGPFAQLYTLYRQVLESAVENPEDMASLRTVLTMVSLTSVHHPLSVTAISSFLSGYRRCLVETSGEIPVRDLLKRMPAILYFEGTEDSDGGMRAYHASFYDFLDEQIRTAADWPSVDEMHLQILRRSLDIMQRQLCFNICKLDTLVLNKDIADLNRRVQDNISEELSYSSRFWFRHLLPSHLAEEDVRLMVSDLLGTKQLLFWLECLSLQGCMDLWIFGLERASELYQVRDQ
jgi:hypothetical protein